MINGLADEFDLSVKESKQLRETIAKAQQDYYKELELLKDETLERILRDIPADHREEVREAARSFFEVDPRKKRSGVQAITLSR